MTSYEQRAEYARRRRLVKAFDASRRRRLDSLLPSTPVTSQQATLAQVANPELLIGVFDEMAATAGPGAGPDGVSYADIGRSQMCAIMRELSQEITAGRYFPSTARTVTVARAHGRGNRKLSLRSILYRVVAGSVLRHVTPYLESIFLDRSFGFRPGIGTWEMLAIMEHDMLTTGKLVLAQDDIKDAFDNVPVGLVIAEFQRHFADQGLLQLIATLLRGNPRKRRGIDQGSPLSPVALNVLLHAHLDLWLDGRGEYLSWYRYADNVVALAHGMPEAGSLRQQVEQRLQTTIGMALKGRDPIVDLENGGKAQCLGFEMSWEGGNLKLKTASESWQNLEECLRGCWKEDHPSLTAQSVAAGWVGAQGPALESDQRQAAIERMLRKAARAGFRGMNPIPLERAAQAAHEGWQAIRAIASREALAPPAPPVAATRLGIA